MNSGKETAAEVVRKILSLLPGVDCGGLGRRRRGAVSCLRTGYR